VIHDHHLQRTTNGKGSIYQHTLEQLTQLDAGKGERIPSLWQVLQRLQQAAQWLNIELKGADTVAPLLTLLDKAQQLGLNSQRLLISSFNHHLLSEIKQLRPEL